RRSRAVRSRWDDGNIRAWCYLIVCFHDLTGRPNCQPNWKYSIGATNALQVFKVSLHSSGIWRIAFVEELKRKDNESDRVLVRWNKPGEFTKGWTPSIAILVPSTSAKEPFSDPKEVDDPRIEWITPPTFENKLLFKILISKAEIHDNIWDSIALPSDQLVACLKKKNGDKVWLALRENRMTPIEAEKIIDVMSKTKIHLKPGSERGSIHSSRALLVVSEKNPTTATQPTIFDIALGKENIIYDPHT
ncbi:MAG: hypothetical protein WC659_01480, partial [Patescibacteria group bacterium]